MGCERDSFFYGAEIGSESGEKKKTVIQGETIRHAGEISREGQEIERKTGRVIHTHIHTLVRDCVVSPKRRKRTRGDH